MRTSNLLFAFAMLLAAAGAYAGEDEQKARGLLDQHKKAVVTIKVVIKEKLSFEGSPSEDMESKGEATGVVIAPEGLTVCPLSSIDPTALTKMMMPMGEDKMKIDSDLSDVKLLLFDGSEIPAKVALRDKDLDLAYLLPQTKPESPMAFVDLNDAGKPELLDRIVSIGRLGKVCNRTYSISFETIEAIVDKPRTFYVPGVSTSLTTLGAPAFTLDGKVVGLFVTRAIKETDGNQGFSMFGRGSSNMVGIILPAADVFEGAKQVQPDGEKKE
jgi:hypothetical protein